MFEEFKSQFPEFWKRQQMLAEKRKEQNRYDQRMYDLFLEIEERAKERNMKNAQEQAEWVIEVYSRLEEEEDKVHALEEEVEHFKELVADLRSGYR